MELITQAVAALLASFVSGIVVVFGAGQYLRGIFDTWRIETDRRLAEVEKASKEARRKEDCVGDMEKLQRSLATSLQDLKESMNAGLDEIYKRLRELEIRVAELSTREKMNGRT